MLSRRSGPFFFVACSLSIAAASATESPTWRQFVEAKRTGSEPIVPDFSYAGYHGGVDSIPDVRGPVFDVTKYGARGDGKTDDQEAIQRAIRAAEGAGGGVVFFPRGTYRINADVKRRRPLQVRKGSIVLRGSGAAQGGTILFIDEPTVKVKTGAAAGGEAEPDWMVQIQPEAAGAAERLATVTGDCPREGFSFPVDNASKVRPGMWVTLNVRGASIVPDVIAPYTLSDLPKEWTRIREGGLYFKENHRVKAVEGNRITLREPVKTALKAAHGWQVAAYPNIAEVGVEDICFMGSWLGKFIHHRSYLDDNGWSALKMQNVVDSWVRRCAFINLNEHMGFDSCAYTSVLQNVLAGTMGHVSIGTPRRCTGMLFGLTLDRMEQQTKDTTHGIGAAGSAVGNVYWRYTMQPDQSFDMHGNFPYATLFDCVVGGNLASSGGPIVSFPNHLQHFVAWNFRHVKMPARIAAKGQYDWWGGRPSLVKPIIVGMHGHPVRVDARKVALNESPGQAVDPESLLEAQLALRFGGKLPAWVEKAQQDWAAMQKNLPEFPRGGDNTPWVARKRLETVQWILDTPMRKELYDKDNPREALLKQWPTSDGKPWVAPETAAP
jgi:uncharacterized protein DUF4955/pectate lyase-like protein